MIRQDMSANDMNNSRQELLLAMQHNIKYEILNIDYNQPLYIHVFIKPDFFYQYYGVFYISFISLGSLLCALNKQYTFNILTEILMYKNKLFHCIF